VDEFVGDRDGDGDVDGVLDGRIVVVYVEIGVFVAIEGYVGVVVDEGDADCEAVFVGSRVIEGVDEAVAVSVNGVADGISFCLMGAARRGCALPRVIRQMTIKAPAMGKRIPIRSIE